MTRPISNDVTEPRTGGQASLRIFVCYRREDTAGFARALKTVLGDRYGRDRVFMDLDNIAPGEMWEDVVNKAVGGCDVLIALMGREWMTVTDKTGRRRIDNPIDPVRLEIETALRERLKVIPALIQEAKMPEADALPSGLASLPGIQALAITDDWDAGVLKLTSALDRIAEEKAQKEASDAVVVVPDAGDEGHTEGRRDDRPASEDPNNVGREGFWRSKKGIRSIVIGVVVLALIAGGIAIVALSGNKNDQAQTGGPSPKVSATNGTTTDVTALRLYLQSAYHLVQESQQQRHAMQNAYDNRDAAAAAAVAAGRRRLVAVAKGLSVPPVAQAAEDALEQSLQNSATADDMYVRVIQGKEPYSAVQAYQHANVIPLKLSFIAMYNKLRSGVSGAPPRLVAKDLY